MNNTYPNKHVYKISSVRLQKAKWKLKINYDTAYKKKEIVDLADSTALRFIREILREKKLSNMTMTDDEFIDKYNQLKARKREINKQGNTRKYSKEYKQLSKDINDLLMVEDYILVEMSGAKHFDRANKAFELNGRKFTYLLSTTGGVKNETVVYVSEDVYHELNRRIDNGRDMEMKFTPAKLSAYRSLVCSASIPVPDPVGILVIKDYEREVEEDVILIKNHPDPENKRPVIEYDENHKMNVNINDGYGFISYRLAQKWAETLKLTYVPSSFIIRNSFCKGVLVVMEYDNFSEKKVIQDVWGNPITVAKTDIVLTTSMLKLWKSYSSIDQYIEYCNKNGYSFSVTKTSPEFLEHKRNLNYQFIQSLTLSDGAIDELVKPTIDMLRDVLGDDVNKTLLYLKGHHLTDKTKMTGNYDFAEALAIDKRMISDPFVRQRIRGLISKRIDDAKKGDLIVDGNFSVIIGDPVALMQHMYGEEPIGLLKKSEFYSAYWNDKGETSVVGFRAPMTVYNNIRKLPLVDSENMRKWYKHLSTVTIFNSYDLTLNALNGADMDGDQLLTTNNTVLKSAVENTNVIICEQTPVEPIVPTRDDFIKADKNGFGNRIGSITNKGTAIYEVVSNYSKGSPEYNELTYRIMSIQKGQQDEIDKMKGIKTKPLPKGWFDKSVWKINEEIDSQDIIDLKNSERKLTAELKPYFFIYIYPYLMNTYKKYKRENNTNSIYNFGLKLEDVLNKHVMTENEEKFIRDYYRNMPVSLSNSVMNGICRKIELEFKLSKLKYPVFYYSILKNDAQYSEESYKAILKIHKEHTQNLRNFKMISKIDDLDEDEVRDTRYLLIEDFQSKVFEINNNIEEVTNIVVDICYQEHPSKSKQFAWDIAGEQIIKNLLSKNNYTVTYPIQDDNGSIEYNGEKFKLFSKRVEVQ